MADPAPRPTLLELAADRFKQDLSLGEAKLFKAVGEGQWADCGEGPEVKGIVRNDRLSWLCTDPKAVERVPYSGISMRWAEVEGEVNLAWAKIPFPLQMLSCIVKSGLILEGCHLRFLNLEGTFVRQLDANAVNIEGAVCLRDGFKAEGGVSLIGATIGSNLDCRRGQFISNEQRLALDAGRAKIGDWVDWSDCKAEGGVSLIATTIGSSLACAGGHFIGNDQRLALDANGAKIERSIFLRHGFKAEGSVDFTGATIGGNFECDGGQFIGLVGKRYRGRWALDANGAKVEGAVFLRNGFKAEGGVNLMGAKIGPSLDCSRGQFIAYEETRALDAEAAEIEGSVFLYDFKADDVVNFSLARVGLSFQWCLLSNAEKAILKLNFAKVGTLLNDEHSFPKKGALVLNGFVYDEIDDQAPQDAKKQLE